MRALSAFPLVAFGVVAGVLSLNASAFDAAALQKEVDEMNQSLPAMVSPVLREEPIRFTGKALMYTFTRVGDAGQKGGRNLNVAARAYLLRQLCGDPDTRQMLRDGLTFTFSYVDDATAPTDGTAVTDRDCPASTAR